MPPATVLLPLKERTVNVELRVREGFEGTDRAFEGSLATEDSPGENVLAIKVVPVRNQDMLRCHVAVSASAKATCVGAAVAEPLTGQVCWRPEHVSWLRVAARACIVFSQLSRRAQRCDSAESQRTVTRRPVTQRAALAACHVHSAESPHDACSESPQ